MQFTYNSAQLKERRRALRRDQTNAEQIMWRHLRNKQIAGQKFYRQYSIGPYILDFYCPAKRLGIELDGGQHNQNIQRNKDQQRTHFLQGQGIEVVRFWNNEVTEKTDEVLTKIFSLVTPSDSPLS